MGRSKTFTEDKVDYLRSLQNMASWEAVEQYNSRFPDEPIVQKQLHGLMTRYKLHFIRKKRECQIVWKEEYLQFMREHAKGIYRKELAELLNATFGTDFTEGQVVGAMKRYGITNGVDMRFQKGHISPVTGMKATEFMTPEQYAVFVSYQYKKGNRPHTLREVGARTVNGGYAFIKVADNQGHRFYDNWKAEHVLEWERHYGPVPKGKAILHLDGDTLNNDISNLYLTDKATIGYMNNNGLLISGDAELNKACALTAELIIATKRKGHQKAGKGAKNDD